MTTGMLLGKFMPPHLGHVYLVEFASHHVDFLTVVVCSLPTEPIPGHLRFGWMGELFPRLNVVHLTDLLPQAPEEHPDFWVLWQAALRRILPGPPDRVFASEPYGKRLAEVLGGQFIPVDLPRSNLRVSGTAIRNDPVGNWDHIPRCVRPYFVRRVRLFGPESTGKTTLAANLAAHFQTVWVPEYARSYLEWKGADPVLEDMETIARGQAASEEALARNARGVLFTDTDVLTTQIWSEELFGSATPWITAEANRRTYDHTLLLDVDVPWVADPIRYRPDYRRDFFTRCQRALDTRGHPYTILRGSWPDRLETATQIVTSLLI